MRTIIAVLALTSAVKCTRVEEPGRPEPATTAAEQRPSAIDGPAAEIRAEAPRERCIAPMPESAPPNAEPASRCPPDPTSGPPTLPRGRVAFVDAPGHPTVDVELARAPEHRVRGLMYRTSLARDEGMLFSWSAEEPRSFWMRNTCIPLDMLFVAADGTIVGVLEQVPTLNDDSRSVQCPAQHVLEVNAGYARAHGVKPGQRIVIED